MIACCMSIQAANVNVTVKMNSTSPWMTLVDKATGDAVSVGDIDGQVYTFDAPHGTYVLTAYAKDSTTINGTIELKVSEDSIHQDFIVLTNTVYATNKHEDKTNWEADKDYTITVDVSTREGDRLMVTLGNSTTAGRKTFLALNGNSYYVSLIPNEAHQAEGYMTSDRSGTLTGGITVSGAIPMGGDYIVTLPADAEVFIGKKFSHFTNFTKVEPSKTEVEGNSKKVYYRLADNQVYNFRTWKAGGLTQGGYFTMDIDGGENSYLKFTDSHYEAFGPKSIKHDVNWNGGYETGNILVNINERGHLQLKVGDTYDALPMRSWQLTDTQTANYFFEPDFHYTIIDLDGNPSTGVIEIDNAHPTTEPWSAIKAVGKGAAIVLVTYDAIALNYYKYNAKADSLTKTNFMGGEYWGAIWPENTAAYVVTVGDDATAMQPNMFINEAYNEGALKTAGKYVDAEHDVFYYLDTEEGATYTFTPEGVDHIEIAYPTIGEQMATYHGFATEGVRKNVDGSYTLLLKEGRQIIKLTDAQGNSIYQVLTAKPCHREITNVSREGSAVFQPGDKVKIQYSGLHHPANKLAGIYNMSAYVTYNNIPNGSSLILGAGQYTFGSVPSAQAVTIDIPADYDTSASDTLVMDEGVIQVNGFGDPIGAHRAINKNLGRSPNFTAIAHKTYFGQLPDVRIPVTAVKRFTLNLQANVDSVEYTITMEGDTLHPNADGLYSPTYGTYIIKATKPGYRCFRTELTLTEGDEDEQTCLVEMVEAGANGWDGTTLTEPELKDGVYQISNGAELAWFAAKVNGGDYKIAGKLTSDIDLCAFEWTPIGGSKSSTAYQGTFEGDGHTIDGLYINNANTYQALFGYIKDSHISGITVDGEVSAKQYVAGVVAYMGTKTYVDRCANKANITGTSTYVGGVTGSVSQATSQLTNAYNLGNIKGTTNCAGVAGYNHKSAVIENAFSLGEVTGNKVSACIGGTTTKDYTKNIFATKEYDYFEGQTTVTDSLMASGEVAYLLGEAFGQHIGTDLHPVLGGAQVYKVTYTTSLSVEADSLYTNGTLPQQDEMTGAHLVWKSSPDGDVLTEVTADNTLFAEYHYVITFLVDGEAIQADTLAYGATIVAPEAPEKEGHTFSGWGEVAETVPASDVIYEGSYTANSYLLTYVVDGETVQADSVVYGTAITALAEPTKEGHTFSGWGEIPATMPAKDVTISGAFIINKYLVTFKIGDEVIASDSLEYGATIVAPKAPEKEGHTFNGWGEVEETVPAGDVTYEGSYTVNVYHVYYYVGEELVHTAEVAYGEAIPEYVYEPTEEGYTFLGWIGDTYETMPAHDVTYNANIDTGIAHSTLNTQYSTVYDLSGRKVLDTENLKGGIYIIDGRKVIIK